jgi:hypothetical protein
LRLRTQLLAAVYYDKEVKLRRRTRAASCGVLRLKIKNQGYAQDMEPLPSCFEILNQEDDECKHEDNISSDIQKFESILNLVNPRNTQEIPKWIMRKEYSAQHDYTHFLATQLRARYTEIDADFRTIFYDYVRNEGNEPLEVKIGTACEIIRLLALARSILEKEELNKQELLLATNHLDLAEECMVWLYPPELAKAGIPSLYSLLDASNPKHQKDYETKLKDLDDGGELLDREKYRSIFDEIIAACNKANLEEMINIGLQIERLRYFKKWGMIMFLFLLISFPLIINVGIFRYWSLQGNTTSIYNVFNFTGAHVSNLDIYVPINIWLLGFIAALGFAIIGGVGGYVSGLLQTRSSKTNLALYEEGVLLSQLRIIFGSIAALISFSLLSWNLLPGILNNSPGPFVLAAFLSGFSERYLLNLLKTEEPESGQK